MDEIVKLFSNRFHITAQPGPVYKYGLTLCVMCGYYRHVGVFV